MTSFQDGLWQSLLPSVFYCVLLIRAPFLVLPWVGLGLPLAGPVKGPASFCALCPFRFFFWVSQGWVLPFHVAILASAAHELGGRVFPPLPPPPPPPCLRFLVPGLPG